MCGITVLVFVAALAGCSSGSGAGFSYGHQADWGQSCNSNTGHQSPIDIITPSSATQLSTGFNVPDELKNVTLTLAENDHTLQLDFPDHKQFDLIVPVTNKTTNPLQLHLHWGGSEHLLNNVRYELECHLVTLGINHMEDTLLTTVFARLFELGTANRAVEQIIAAFEAGHDDPSWIQFNLAKLYPDTIKGIYSYAGSLTTPPCTEGIQWVVVQDVLTVSQDQLDRIKDLHLSGNLSLTQNFRDTQPLNDREIQLYELNSASVPQAALCVVLLVARLVLG